MQGNLKSLFQTEGFFKCIVLFGVVSVLGVIFMGWGGIEFATNFGIRKFMRVSPGSIFFEQWRTGMSPVYIKLYLFNVTNPHEILDGKKPEVQEVGPYVYLVKSDMLDLERELTHDTFKYSPTRTYYFQHKMSKGKENDLITNVNPMFTTISQYVQRSIKTEEDEWLLDELDKALLQKGETPFRTEKVKDIIFKGVSIKNFVDLSREQFLLSVKMPKLPRDGLLALLKGQNGTRNGHWECNTGTRNISKRSMIRSYNGLVELDNYEGDTCNEIHGTDGTLYPPFSEPKLTQLSLFIPEICRSIQWESLGTLSTGRFWSWMIPVGRYKFPNIKAPIEDPNDACFCSVNDPDHCDIHGIVSLAPCYDGIPLLYSKPHFLGVDRSVKEMIKGVQPKATTHESVLHIHQLFGLVVSSSVKMQLSLDLSPVQKLPSFKNVSKAFVPLVWIEMETKLDGFFLLFFQLFSLFLRWYPILRWPAFFASVCIILLGGVLIHRSRQQLAAEASDSEDDYDITPDISQEVGIWLKKRDKSKSHDE